MSSRLPVSFFRVQRVAPFYLHLRFCLRVVARQDESQSQTFYSESPGKRMKANFTAGSCVQIQDRYN
jgi:hypothetical protein